MGLARTLSGAHAMRSTGACWEGFWVVWGWGYFQEPGVGWASQGPCPACSLCQDSTYIAPVADGLGDWGAAEDAGGPEGWRRQAKGYGTAWSLIHKLCCVGLNWVHFW